MLMDMVTCPACRLQTFEASGFEVDLNDVLRRWEKIMGKSFVPEVSSHYQHLACQPLTHFRCSTCGFGRFEPVVAGTQAFYEAITANEYYVADKWEFQQAIRDLRYEGVGRVLDMGCGSGNFLKLLREAEPSISLVGQEIYEGVLDANKYHIEMLIGGVDDITRNLSDIGKFEAITLFQVLEHIPDPWTLLQACSESLHSGGILIVSTPDGDGPISHFKDALTEIPPHHLTQWTEAAYRACLPRFGFDVVHVRREPLPHYLWDAYLPVLWGSSIWPAQLLAPFLSAKNRSGDELGIAAQLLRQAGITHLHGVPGHTIYIKARFTHVV
jgi:SAM-dependent methyltransferase